MKNAFRENILNGKYDNIIQYNEDIADCIERIPDGLSLVFIDGCHEHEFAMRELELLSPKIIPGGWVYLHDSGWEKGSISLTDGTGLINTAKRICPPYFDDIKILGTMTAGKKVGKLGEPIPDA
jgi:hypothetical protein